MKRYYGLYVGLGLLALLLLPAARAVVLEFQPPAQTFDAGDVIRVDVGVMNLAGEIVAAYDLAIRYAAGVLAAAEVAFSAALGTMPGVDWLESVPLGPGRVTLAAVSLLSDTDLAGLQAGLGDPTPLATITFTALAAGDTGSLSFAPGGEVIGRDHRVIVSVPAPGTALLLGAGLVASGVRRRMKRRTG